MGQENTKVEIPKVEPPKVEPPKEKPKVEDIREGESVEYRYLEPRTGYVKTISVNWTKVNHSKYTNRNAFTSPEWSTFVEGTFETGETIYCNKYKNKKQHFKDRTYDTYRCSTGDAVEYNSDFNNTVAELYETIVRYRKN